MKTIDLTLGHPLYLGSYWNWQSFSPNKSPQIVTQANEGLAYNTSGGIHQLQDSIFEMHCHVKNARVIGSHIVVGHGATQLVGAAIAQSPFKDIYSRSPHFFRFDQIFKANGKSQIFMPDGSGDYSELVTHPSNPENIYYPETQAKFKVHDLCYNWPQYGTVIQQDKPIMIFSLAKATGHAGSRIGWAIVRDKAMYEGMCEYIDVSTGGVSYEAQRRASIILNEQSSFLWQQAQQKQVKNPPLPKDVFSFGQNVLAKRWATLLKVNPSKIKFLNCSGMFAWCEIPGESDPTTHLFQFYSVKGLSGPVCGGLSHQVRLNIGCSQDDFDELANRLS